VYFGVDCLPLFNLSVRLDRVRTPPFRKVPDARCMNDYEVTCGMGRSYVLGNGTRRRRRCLSVRALPFRKAR